MDFTSKIIVERTAVCSRSSVKEQGIGKNIYMYFIYKHQLIIVHMKNNTKISCIITGHSLNKYIVLIMSSQVCVYHTQKIIKISYFYVKINC